VFLGLGGIQIRTNENFRIRFLRKISFLSRTTFLADGNFAKGEGMHLNEHSVSFNILEEEIFDKA